MQEKQTSRSSERLYMAFIYLVLGLLAISIVVPVAWVFMASIKQNSEFYSNPWALPAGFYWQNFVDAWNGAKMGSYMLNSVVVTALALVLLLIIALPAAYCLARFKFMGQKVLHTLFMAGLFINVNYIVVPIFLMLRDGDNWIKSLTGGSFLLNNLFVLAIVYAATALPFTIYLLSGYFATLAHDYEEAAYIRVHHLHDADEFHQCAAHPARGPFEPDAGPAERRPVRHHVRRPGAGHAADAHPLHLRAETADPGHDRGRPERLR